MMLMKKIALAGLMLGAVVACKPTNDGDNNNGGGDDDTVPQLTGPVNEKTASSYEQFITRTAGKATIDMEINLQEEGKPQLIWMVGATVVEKGATLPHPNPAEFGEGSNNMLFNWMKADDVKVTTDGSFLGQAIDAPMPLWAPAMASIMFDLWPSDPGVVYAEETIKVVGAIDSPENVEIIYQQLFENTKNANALGALWKAALWGKTAGNEVDLVFYIYKAEEDFQYYTSIVGAFPPNFSKIPEAIAGTHIAETIELQRFTITLE